MLWRWNSTRSCHLQFKEVEFASSCHLQFKRQLEVLSRQGNHPKLMALEKAVLEHFGVPEGGEAPGNAADGQVSTPHPAPANWERHLSLDSCSQTHAALNGGFYASS